MFAFGSFPGALANSLGAQRHEAGRELLESLDVQAGVHPDMPG